MDILDRTSIDALFSALRARGFTTVGPIVRDGVIVYDEIESSEVLPVGWMDQQDGGTYRLVKREDKALFGYVVGPSSWKAFLFLAAQRLWKARRTSEGFELDSDQGDPPRYAFIGVRPCELRAMTIQDRVFRTGDHADSAYLSRRENTFLVAVNCTLAGGTCFCDSMGTGPKAESGFDLSLTEVISEGRHYFVVDAGSPQGRELFAELPHEPAGKNEIAAAEAAVENARSRMGRSMDTEDIQGLLYRNLTHYRWDTVAERCLACGNCTLVCPTCFCSTVEDRTDLSGENAERWRKWDSCFTAGHSYIHGGSIRPSIKSRYRQWMTHKLASWIDQFGTSGCVGCGRCITWCPVGIDITEEVEAIRKSEKRRRELAEKSKEKVRTT